MNKPKILLFDIESTSLNATFGTILCIGYKWLNKDKVHIPTILDKSSKGMLDDSILVKKFADEFIKCDYVVSWYGIRFDLPMINSKLIKYGLGPLPYKPHLDLWDVAKKNFKLHSNRLQAWSEFLGCGQRKSSIEFDHWLRAALGNKKSLECIVDHCYRDVLVLEEVFLKMRPWVKDEPALQLFDPKAEGACPSCGSFHLQSRGYQVSKTRRYKRYQCMDCTKWFRAGKSERPGPIMIGG